MKNSSSSYKLGEYTKWVRGERRVDRLSNLPDSVLHHILSFLSTKSAVQTTVLSRRWRCVWKHVSVIDIRGDSFKYNQSLFRLISDCKLESLVLRDCTIDTGFQSSGFGFRVLTRLELIGCTVLENHDDVIDPFSKFTCLRTLELFDLSTSLPRKVFRISGLQLISLKIQYSQFDKIEVYAPKLKSFAIVDQGGISEFSKFTLPSLEYADIWVEFGDDGDDYEYASQHMISLFQGVNNAMSLRLESSTVEVFFGSCTGYASVMYMK
ncbi:F-box/FBD/LRR-repeat protein At1g16930 [Linum perenne]